MFPLPSASPPPGIPRVWSSASSLNARASSGELAVAPVVMPGRADPPQQQKTSAMGLSSGKRQRQQLTQTLQQGDPLEGVPPQPRVRRAAAVAAVAAVTAAAMEGIESDLEG